MRYIRSALIWLVVVAIFGFILWKWILPLFKPPKVETDIQTTEVKRGDLRDVVPADGKVTPAVQVEVKSKASGLVEKLFVEPGDIVKAGDILVELDKEQIIQELKQVEAQLLQAKVQLEKIKRNLTDERHQQLESAVDQAQVTYDRQKAAYERIKELAEHDPPFATKDELDQAKASLDQAELALKDAKKQLDLALAGGEKDDIAIAQANVEQQQAVVDNMQEELNYTTVRAPISGTVLSRPVEVGTAVASATKGQQAGTIVAVIAELDTLYVQAKIEETSLGRVKPAAPCRISFDAYPGWLWTGSVTKIYPQGEDSEGGTQFPVDIGIDLKSGKRESDTPSGGSRGGGNGGLRVMGGPGGPHPVPPGGGAPAASKPAPSPEGEAGKPEKAPALLPMMTANVEIVLEEHPGVLILPAQFVKFENGKPYCEVLPDPKDMQKRVRHDIQLGYTDGVRYEVKEGLEEGDTVVLERPIKKDQRMF